MSDLSRVEQLLRNALGEDIYEVTPQSRVEALLVELNELIEGMDSSVSPEDIATAVSAYLTEHLTNPSNPPIDTSLSIAGAAADAKETGDQISQLKSEKADVTDLLKAFPVDTASGAIASFSDGAELPLKSLTVDIEPIQDLHGYDHPWPAGGTKNKMPNAIPKTETINGVTFKLDEFGIFTVTGTATGEANCDFPIGYSFVIPDGDPKPKVVLNNTQSSSALFKFFNNSTQIDSWGMTPSYRTTEYTDMRGKTCNSYRITVPSGATVNVTLSPMIVENSVTDYTYIPYSNICPITGFDGLTVTRTGKNMINPSELVYSAGGNNDNVWYGIHLPPDTDFVFSTDSKITGVYVAYSDADEMPSISGTGWSNIINKYNTTSLSFNSGSHKWYRLTTYEMNGVIRDRLYQFELGTTATAYEPYSGQSINIQFGQTVYGGTLDVVSGELVIDRYYTDGINWTQYAQSNGYTAYKSQNLPLAKSNTDSMNLPISNAVGEFGSFSSASMDKTIMQPPRANSGAVYLAYPDGADPTGVTLSYLIKDPVTIQLTPHEVTALLGSNNVWADTGDSTVEYRADPTLYIQRLTEPDADMVADANITSGQYFMVGNTLYKATANIASGAIIAPNVNCTRKSLSEALNELNV